MPVQGAGRWELLAAPGVTGRQSVAGGTHAAPCPFHTPGEPLQIGASRWEGADCVYGKCEINTDENTG